METVRVGGRRYSDPDVVALVRATGGLIDPRSAVVTQARKLNQLFRSFDSPNVTPLERLEILASCVDLELVSMSPEQCNEESRDAVLILNGIGTGKKGQILYNPQRPPGRIAFSVGHEIGHTFFPATTGGARFREMCESESREANELERLCDLAASELLMPIDEFQQEVDVYTMHSTRGLMQRFGSSFESTAFRLATAHPGVAAAGLLQFRLRKEEQRRIDARISNLGQGRLFSSSRSETT